jgi:cephalosporin-C deacetylase-like acetyl esterase
VVHHLGGSFEAEEFLARHLGQHGVAAFFISLPNYGKRQEKGTRQGFLRLPPRDALLGFRQAVLDVIRAGDFLRSRPGVDPERVGVAGVSMGAFVAALARGVDPRLGRTVLITGGGDLPELLRHHPEVRLHEQPGVDPARLPEILAKVDPVTFAARIRTQDVLMLNATNDELVSRSSTLALWEALRRPRIRWFKCGHYGVAIHILTLMNSTLDFLRR